MRKGAIERILDEDDYSIIEISDKEGYSYKFNQVALVEVEERLFTILELIDSEPEEIAFEITSLGEGNVELNIVPDDSTIDSVFEAYEKLLEDTNKDKEKKQI